MNPTQSQRARRARSKYTVRSGRKWRKTVMVMNTGRYKTLNRWLACRKAHLVDGFWLTNFPDIEKPTSWNFELQGNGASKYPGILWEGWWDAAREEGEFASGFLSYNIYLPLIGYFTTPWPILQLDFNSTGHWETSYQERRTGPKAQIWWRQ